jgi:hypothetical protein
MTREPELIISRGDDGNPDTAVCSACGESMPEDFNLSATAREIILIFVEHFNTHVREKHGPRYVN